MKLSKDTAKKLWIHAQKLDMDSPFGKGPKATTKAIEHLGYVQIDTINVIERCHHHILYNRIPGYKKTDLHHGQSISKSIFEYWTHALSYVPTKDFHFFLGKMKSYENDPEQWLRSVKKEELSKVFKLIQSEGPVSIRDIDDDVLVEKKHPWGSRKPSKKALLLGFYSGRLVISERQGMLKKYELTERHFEWDKRPKAATPNQINEYMLERALRSQCLVSLDSICHLEPSRKPAMRKLIESKIKSGDLIAVHFENDSIKSKDLYWAKPLDLEVKLPAPAERIHILSPFDPLIIQRKRLKAFFDYEHRFEAYLPKEKRLFGYFGLPVLKDDQIIAVIDLKTDRQAQELLMQKWTWLGKNKSTGNKNLIEDELHRFEKFQLEK